MDSDFDAVFQALQPFGIREISTESNSSAFAGWHGNRIQYGPTMETVRLDLQTTRDQMKKLAAIALVAERYDEAEWPRVLEALTASSILTGDS